MPHGGQRLIHIHDQRVLRAAVGDQTVALQQLFVVFCDLRFDVGALDARVGRQQLVPVGVVSQIVPDVPRHVELVVQREYQGVRLVALRHVHAGGRLHVRQQMFALVRRYVLVHVSELPLDHPQTLVDEHRGADGDLVFILHPVFVVNGDQRVENVFGALDGMIPECKVDDRCLFAAQGYGQVRGVLPHRSVQAAANDIQRIRLLAFVVGRGLYFQDSQGCRYRVGQPPGDFVVELIAVAGEIGQPDGTVRLYA